jgi:hypothetical protein
MRHLKQGNRMSFMERNLQFKNVPFPMRDTSQHADITRLCDCEVTR